MKRKEQVNMKRLMALLLAAVLALSLVACGGGSGSNETSSTDVETTLDLDNNEYLLTLVKNVYNQSIPSGDVILGYALAGENGTIGTNGGVKVYLDNDELVNLNNLETITVSGKLIDDENNEVTAILENAHIVE